MNRDEYIGGNSIAVFLTLCMVVAAYVGDDVWNGLLWQMIFPVFLVYVHWWFWQLHKSRRISYGVRPAATLLAVAVVSFAVSIVEEWCWAFSLGWDCQSALISSGNWHNIIGVPAMLMFFLSPLYMFLWCLHVGKTHVQHKLLYQMLILLIGLGLLFSVGFVVLLIISFGYLGEPIMSIM